MIERKGKNGRITFHCDTRPYKATLATGYMTLNGASGFARERGWAIGNTTDACPEHHV